MTEMNFLMTKVCHRVMDFVRHHTALCSSKEIPVADGYTMYTSTPYRDVHRVVLRVLQHPIQHPHPDSEKLK